MHKILFFSLIAMLFTACGEFKLPELPKIQKSSEPTEAECAKIVKKYKELRSRGYVGNEPSLERDYSLEANYCEKKYTYSPSTDEMIKNIEKLGN
ncbi:TPA: hypothetical protein RQJ16_001780 [Campylobacter fetus subsp. venerealis]|nr:hypothetical protein [Campylobacter fetus subsp. venerealis]HDX6296076.1 hypothetical protein [Campylobacter fetus subsp. venerealis]HDX6309287.1 hypothetical protein [Campylobacter fetus subsp. venerealis]HDX8135933.1 hypothetical protein [Campylobacter fetus subsp. venerealis]